MLPVKNFIGVVDETLDLYSATGEPLGRSKTRALVHRDGDWHRQLPLDRYFLRVAIAAQRILRGEKYISV